ncbi:ATP synthase delta chain [Streptococcus sp. HSISB1]|nr:ATP synthase delta chain [Streptococcus sp. HSISB1]
MDKKTQALVEQYAKSLVEIAIEKDSLAELQSETEALLSVFEETNLADSLSSLVVSRDEKVKLVRLLQESSSVYMNNFLEVILQNEREALLKAILEGVQKDFVIATNQHDIVVTTAVALTDEQKNVSLLWQLKNLVSKQVNSLKTSMNQSLVDLSSMLTIK